jgi:hypothetical protein
MFITQRRCVSLGEEIDWRQDEYLVTSGWNDKLDLYNVIMDRRCAVGMCIGWKDIDVEYVLRAKFYPL